MADEPRPNPSSSTDWPPINPFTDDGWQRLPARAVPAPPYQAARPSCLGRLVRLLAALLIVWAGMSAVGASIGADTVNHVLQYVFAGDELKPGDASAVPSSFVCDGVDPKDAKRIRQAFTLVVRTAEGARLYRQLGAYRICVGVGDLPYNSGYTAMRRSLLGSWSGKITLDTALVRADEPDVLAASLVHEATHVDRSVTGVDCAFTDSCTILPNGIRLDEEVAAHAAEARWWIAAYGAHGKRFAFRFDAGENRLAAAYRQGPQAFADYVRNLRGDPREGSGFTTVTPAASDSTGAAPPPRA